MVAAAFKGTIVLRNNAGIRTVPFTASDVNAAYYIFPSGASDLQLSADGVTYVTDVILSAAGTDTSKGDIFVNDMTIGQQILNSANVGTVFNRQFMSAPLALKPGSRLRIQQLT
jgi:hypothetical protein